MRRTVIACLVAAGTIVGAAATAQADYLHIRWHDTIQPGGHKRSEAVARPIELYCQRKGGVPVTRLSAAYKSCMQQHGYSLVSATWVRERGGNQWQQRWAPQPSVDTSWVQRQDDVRHIDEQRDADMARMGACGFTC
jgi:hypothetical protein